VSSVMKQLRELFSGNRPSERGQSSESVESSEWLLVSSPKTKTQTGQDPGGEVDSLSSQLHLSQCLSFTYRQRIVAFVLLLVAGMIFSALSMFYLTKVFLGRPQKVFSQVCQKLNLQNPPYIY